MSGDHNFTLRSIAKLEAELGVELLYVSKKRLCLNDRRESLEVSKPNVRRPFRKAGHIGGRYKKQTTEFPSGTPLSIKRLTLNYTLPEPACQPV